MLPHPSPRNADAGATAPQSWARRRFFSAALLPLLTATGECRAQEDFWQIPRTLWLQRRETGEEIRACYWQDGQLLAEGHQEANQILRDVRANSVAQMDVVLLDLIFGIQGWFRAYGWNLPYEITSGYRTKATNDALRSEGAVWNSKHLEGKASDGRVRGIPTEYLGKLALYLRGGGVGIYVAKNFIHTDTGNIRQWRG